MPFGVAQEPQLREHQRMLAQAGQIQSLLLTDATNQESQLVSAMILF